MGHELPPEYENRVCYDTYTGEFARVVDTGDSIGLILPDAAADATPYFTFDEEGYGKEDALDKVETDFRPVSEEAIENPATVIEDAIELVSRNDVNELMSMAFQQAIDVRYAASRVSITEIE